MRLLVMASLVVGVVAAGCGDEMSATGGTGGVGADGGSGGGGGMVWPCTEAGIRDAIAAGGGPHRFACDGPTTVTTKATIEIDNDVWLDGEGNLTVDGNQDHTVFMVPASAESTLSGMTITGGRGEALGGGMSSFGDLFIEDSEIVENTAGEIGGGIYSAGGDLTLTNTLVARNEAMQGGGMLVANVEVIESTIVENVGGGIDSLGSLTVRDSTIARNITEFGGGGVGNSGDALIIDSLIADNEALIGGGIASAS